MNPDQTAPICLFERLLKHFSRREKQTNFVVIGALRVNFIFILILDLCELSGPAHILVLIS